MSNSQIVDNLTPIRVCVQGQKLTVYVGKSEFPVFSQDNFLVLATNDIGLKFGKTDPTQQASTWAWGQMRFLANATPAPITRVTNNWYLSWRFPSTGGVRNLVGYLGTVWALTDGLGQGFRFTDNLDDRQAKAFSYLPDQQVWQQETAPFPGRSDNNGVVRPLGCAVFQGTLLASGQIGQIV